MPVLARFDERTFLGLEQDVHAHYNGSISKGVGDLAKSLIGHLPSPPSPRDG
jgi:hypothetical protein